MTKQKERKKQPDRTYTISDLAQEFGVTPRAIRFYEDRRLLYPQRVGQTRVYSSADHARLAWILRGKRVGLSLSDIAELLDMYDLGDNRLTQRRATLAKCRERIDVLVRQREDIDCAVKELEDFCATLERLLAEENADSSGTSAANR